MVTDGWVDPQIPNGIVYPRDRAAILQSSANDLFLVATENDEIGTAVIEDVTRRGAKYVPVRAFGPAAYFHTDLVWRKAAHHEYLEQQRLFSLDKWDIADFDNIAQAIANTRSVDGAYVELGCFRGASGSVALAYMNALGLKRQTWFFDVFDGFNYEAAKTSADTLWLGSHATEGLEGVARTLRRYQTPDLPVTVEKRDIFVDDIAHVGPIAMANIDVDLYEAVLAGLEKCAPLMAPGGIMIAEDPGHTPGVIGSRLAVEEFNRQPIAEAFFSFYLSSGQRFFVRKS